jgi:hypothetical protein
MREPLRSNQITNFGRKGFELTGDDKNGEGIYIGTAPGATGPQPTRHPRSIRRQPHPPQLDRDAGRVRGHQRGRHRQGGHRQPLPGLEGSRRRRVLVTGHPYGVPAQRQLAGMSAQASAWAGPTTTTACATCHRHTGLKVIRMPQGLICGNRVERNCDGDVNVNGVDSDRRCPARSVAVPAGPAAVAVGPARLHRPDC